MDPNEALSQIRKLADEILSGGSGGEGLAVELADAVRALDTWMRRGGFPPDDWGPSCT